MPGPYQYNKSIYRRSHHVSRNQSPRWRVRHCAGRLPPQFPTLVPEFEGQYAAFKKTLPDTVDVIDGGIVTTKEQSMAAGDKFRAAGR